MKSVTVVSNSHTPHSPSPLLHEAAGNSHIAAAIATTLPGIIMALCVVHERTVDDSYPCEKFSIVSPGGKAASSNVLPDIPAAASRLVNDRAVNEKTVIDNPAIHSFVLKAVYSITPEPPFLLNIITAKQLDNGISPWAGASADTEPAVTLTDTNELLSSNTTISVAGTKWLKFFFHHPKIKFIFLVIALHISLINRQCVPRRYSFFIQQVSLQTFSTVLPVKGEKNFRARVVKDLPEKSSFTNQKSRKTGFTDERMCMYFLTIAQFLSTSPIIRIR